MTTLTTLGASDFAPDISLRLVCPHRKGYGDRYIDIGRLPRGARLPLRRFSVEKGKSQVQSSRLLSAGLIHGASHDSKEFLGPTWIRHVDTDHSTAA
jgi:hypothetical protein